MKRWIAIMVVPFVLIGCKNKSNAIDMLYTFRENLLCSTKVTFDTEITVDYGQDYYTFEVTCSGNENGDLSFEVVRPDTIHGIQGTVIGEEGHLTFDHYALAFKTIAEGRVTPVNAPWVFLTSLRGGYITACSSTENGYLAIIRDTYEENPLIFEIAFEDNKPISAEVYWNETRIISMLIRNFTVM